jgi:hypothetical protein
MMLSPGNVTENYKEFVLSGIDAATEKFYNQKKIPVVIGEKEFKCFLKYNPIQFMDELFAW